MAGSWDGPNPPPPRKQVSTRLGSAKRFFSTQSVLIKPVSPPVSITRFFSCCKVQDPYFGTRWVQFKYCPRNLAVKKNGRAWIQKPDSWFRSANASSVLCRPAEILSYLCSTYLWTNPFLGKKIMLTNLSMDASCKGLFDWWSATQSCCLLYWFENCEQYTLTGNFVLVTIVSIGLF